MKLSHKQYDLLQGFYAHCYCVYHHNSKADFVTWAELLDNAKVPWSLQNRTALKAEDRRSIDYYLSTLIDVQVG